MEAGELLCKPMNAASQILGHDPILHSVHTHLFQSLGKPRDNKAFREFTFTYQICLKKATFGVGDTGSSSKYASRRTQQSHGAEGQICTSILDAHGWF